MDQMAFREAKDFAPNIVVIMLGTNDAIPDVYQHAAFEADYKELISELQALKSKPKIWLTKPPPIFSSLFSLDNTNLTQGVIPSIERTASERGLPIIDVYGALANHPEKFFEDGIHPNLDGAKAIAAQVKKAITATNEQ
jgi:lysophospholipase L1-like esterase